MKNNKINSTDLHIQYKLDTGEYHSYAAGHMKGDFTTDIQYKSSYVDWLQEQLINKINKNI